MQVSVRLAVVGLATAAILTACGGGTDAQTFRIAGIPDQDSTKLARRYDALTSYLTSALGVEVEYVPTVDYAATVVGFKQGSIHMAWFGGFTGVQARIAVPGSEAIAQRPQDAEFHSRFIVQAGLDVNDLTDLAGLTFTFGSESSTSGHVMPRHFMLQSGLDPDQDLRGAPNFSGSHDKTWKLVESGAFQAGVLNEAVWESAIAEGRVDTAKVREFFTTPAYFDYNWTIRGDVDDTFGEGFGARVQRSLLQIDVSQETILDVYSTAGFIATSDENYALIEDVSRALGFVQ